MKTIISEFILGDMLVQYILSESSNVGLELIPLFMKAQQKKEKKFAVDSLVQVKLEQDDFPYGFANGLTMRNSSSTYLMKYKNQTIKEDENNVQIITELANDSNQKAQHILSYDKSYQVIELKVIYYNNASETISVEMLSSFSLCGITPFEQGEAPETLMIHRMRSKWSTEGRMESVTAEELLLEPSWSRHASYSEKFGQIGSMPVRKYFPFAAVEDTKNNVIWAVQLGCASSWQIELYRRDEGLCISGGLADYEFGHWRKSLKQREWLETPVAYLTVCNGTIDEACHRLVKNQKKTLPKKNKTRLPVVFNEFCTTWGRPSQDNIGKILQAVKNSDLDYFVIDAGWYADPIKGWEKNIGDWIISKELFEDGLKETVNHIKKAGLKAGIWFELEICASDSNVFYEEESHLLKRNGKTITVGDRRFFDMRDPWTVDYLSEKVIKFLNDYGFEYLKIDYNESIGLGCDGEESLSEGLRQNMLASQRFFGKIRNEVPGIMIEVCASGGHRLEPSMLALADMASFSDAHEEKEIPIIAANLHRALLPEKSQIWAVLRQNDTKQRLVYSIINTYLGVMCLSGDVYDLNEEQWATINEGIAFYRTISDIIQNGFTRYFGTKILSYRFPKGWQGIVRYFEDKTKAIVLIHSFLLEGQMEIEIPLESDYQINQIYEANSHNFIIRDKKLTITMTKEYDAVALYLT